MKGLFFINFMIVMSCVAVFSLVLWNYIMRTSRKLAVVVGGLAVTLVAVGELAYYGMLFPQWISSPWKGVLFYGALASLSWLFIFLLAFPVLLLGALGVCIWRRTHRSCKREEQDHRIQAAAVRPQLQVSRRTFLKGAAAAIPVAAAATSTLGNVVGESCLDVSLHRLSYSTLPDYLEGYKIGQISDVHMGLFFSPERLQEAMDALVAQGVQRLEITGDLIDELSLLPACRRVIEDNASRFPDGVDFCYGNHEYYRSLPAIRDMLEQTPVRILCNSHIEVSPGRGEQLAHSMGHDDRPFYIAGVDYSFAKGDEAFAAEREAFVQDALEGIPDDAFVVMLAHHSAFIDETFAHHIPLTLCGHTHGAQFAPIGPIVETVGFKYLRGLFRQGESVGYVNRGTGHWLPLRVFCSREVSVFELHRN